MSSEPDLSLYVHAPFCASRCRYCNFYSGEPLSGIGEFPGLVGREARLRGEELGARRAATLYIGGGTPSLLGVGGLRELIYNVTDHFPLAPDAEVTVEVNPGAPLDWEELRATGTTRVSLGVQALGERELTTLGRSHDAETALKAVRGAVGSGLRVSADLIYGYAGCEPASVAGWAQMLAEEGVEHLSAYSLEPKPGGPAPSTEEEEELTGAALASRLEALGFVRYEVSNFARPGCESRHNTAYWEGRSYLGLGPGAHSFFAEAPPHGRRAWNLPGLAAYREALLSGSPPPSGEEFPSEEEAVLERLFLTLRRAAPFSAASLWARGEITPLLDRLLSSGDLERASPDLYLPTGKGLDRADGLASWLHAQLFSRSPA